MGQDLAVHWVGRRGRQAVGSGKAGSRLREGGQSAQGRRAVGTGKAGSRHREGGQSVPQARAVPYKIASDARTAYDCLFLKL